MIKSRVSTFVICLSLLLAAEVSYVQSKEFDSERSHELVRRNIFGGNGSFSIDDPRVYQYGNVHVDGPSGGMLYRFKTNLGSLKWIVISKQLEKTTIDSTAELPLDFLDNTPKWWKPIKANVSAFYSIYEKLPVGGKRLYIVTYDDFTGLIYIVEHFSEMRGV